MENIDQDQRPLTRNFHEKIKLFGLCESEFSYLQTVTDWTPWYSHKLKQLECIRSHIEDPGRLLYELVQSDFEHPDKNRAASAHSLLESWEQGFNPCTNPKGLIFEEEIQLCGISTSEISYLQTVTDWNYWFLYKLKQLECIRSHIEDPGCLLYELVRLECSKSNKNWVSNAAFTLLVWDAKGYPFSNPPQRKTKPNRNSRAA